jgi:hypothetical protein
VGGVTTAAAFMRPVELEVTRLLGAPQFANGRSLSTGSNHLAERSLPLRGDGTNINNAVAPTLSQKGKSGRFLSICFESRAYHRDNQRAGQRFRSST